MTAMPKLMMMISSEGGIDIEDVAITAPEKIHNIFFPNLKNISLPNFLKEQLEISSNQFVQLCDIIEKLVKAFVSLANKLSEDTMVKGDQVPYLTVPEINKQIASLQQPGSAYWDKRNPGHDEAVKEVQTLIRKKNNEENVE